jgi:hypothetical protein
MSDESVLEQAERVKAYSQFRKVAKHYECPPDEVKEMEEAIRRDKENALVTFKNLYAEIQKEPDDRPDRETTSRTAIAGWRICQGPI